MRDDNPTPLVDRVLYEYARRNAAVMHARATAPAVHAAWNTVTGLVRDVDALLRAWRVPADRRAEMAEHLLVGSFGDERGRWGADYRLPADERVPGGER